MQFETKLPLTKQTQDNLANFCLFLWEQVDEFNTQKKQINHIFVSDADMTRKKSYTEKILKNARKNFN